VRRVLLMSCRSTTSKPSLVIPASPRTKLKTPTSPATGAIKRAPVKSKRKRVKARQSGVFKRFTVYIIDFFKEKFVWAKKKPVPVSVDAEHDKRIVENYVFDEVLGIYVSHMKGAPDLTRMTTSLTRKRSGVFQVALLSQRRLIPILTTSRHYRLRGFRHYTS